MKIKYINPKKPRQKGIAKLPLSKIADTIVALKCRGFLITSVK